MLGWQVTVLDMDLWGMSDNIGSHQLDLAYVYSKPNHEIVEQVRARCCRVTCWCAMADWHACRPLVTASGWH